MQQRTCRTCGATFTPTHSRNIYCNPGCRKDEHPKVQKTCDCCGQPCMKAPTPRYAETFCSLLCRDYKRWGSLSRPLPADHWARWYGRTSAWTPSAPDVTARFQTGTCRDCEAPITEPTGQTPSRYCSTACSRRTQKRARRAREAGAPGTFTNADVMRQYRRQGNTCAYCHLHRGLPEVEHVVALSRGGRNDMSNIVAACSSCNASKNDMTLDEWVDERRRLGLPKPDVTLTGPAYMHLALSEPTGTAWRHRVA